MKKIAIFFISLLILGCSNTTTNSKGTSTATTYDPILLAIVYTALDRPIFTAGMSETRSSSKKKTTTTAKSQSTSDLGFGNTIETITKGERTTKTRSKSVEKSRRISTSLGF